MQHWVHPGAAACAERQEKSYEEAAVVHWETLAVGYQAHTTEPDGTSVPTQTT